MRSQKRNQNRRRRCKAQQACRNITKEAFYTKDNIYALVENGQSETPAHRKFHAQNSEHSWTKRAHSKTKKARSRMKCKRRACTSSGVRAGHVPLHASLDTCVGRMPLHASSGTHAKRFLSIFPMQIRKHTISFAQTLRHHMRTLPRVAVESHVPCTPQQQSLKHAQEAR